MIQQSNVYKKLFQYMEETYNKKDSIYKDIRELLAPGTGFFAGDESLENHNIDYTKQLDSEPSHYLDTTTSGMYGGLVNPASKWFDLTIDKTKAKNRNLNEYIVNISLEQCKEFLYYLLIKSNFYESIKPVLSEWIRYGFGTMLIEERDYSFVFFNPLTVGEYYLGINSYGEYTRLARKFTKTADQLVDDFGKENLPEEVLNAYENKDYKRQFEVCHLICENNHSGLVPSRFKFMDLYWLSSKTEEQKFLRTSGFMSNPIVVFAADRKNLRTIYPLGIGEKILGDVRELQKTVKQINIHKSFLTNPALALHTSLGRKPVLPGSRFYTDQDPSKVVSEIYRVNSYIAELEDSRARLMDKIRKMSMADILMLFAQNQQGNKTATEVSAIVREQMTLLAPMYLQAKSGLDNIFKRLIDICVRRKAFPKNEFFDPAEIGIEFVSSIAKAQRVSEVGSIQELVLNIAQLAQVKPGALDYINEDEIVKNVAGILGLSSKINSDEKVAQIRQAQAQAQQMQQQLAVQREQMKIAKDASRARLDPASVLGQSIVEQGGSLPEEAYPQEGAE